MMVRATRECVQTVDDANSWLTVGILYYACTVGEQVCIGSLNSSALQLYGGFNMLQA